MSSTLIPFIVPAVLFVLLGIAARVGLRLGRRAHRRATGRAQANARGGKRQEGSGSEELNPSHHPKFNVIESAMLALLGLMIGFSFSGAMDRYGERTSLLVAESNAIQTAYMRAALIKEPHRTRMREEFREYIQERLKLFGAYDPRQAEPIQARLLEIQRRIFDAATAGVDGIPDLASPVLDPVNDSFDLLEARNVSVRRHLPVLVLVVLAASAVASIGAVYFGLSEADRRVQGYAAVLTFLIWSSLWITIDMDYPQIGFIRTSPQPLLDLRDSIDPATGGAPRAATVDQK